MKKTIQINIAGVVLTIEDDAYAKLNNYLKSIQTYFANYEGSQEIISDIEARIAEKFLEKQGTDNQVIISSTDVDSLIASMGTVADFEALDEDGDYEAASAINEGGTATPNNVAATPENGERKRIFRDTKRKALGGVLAGMAHYFNMDVTWVRIIFLIFAIGLSPITESGASGFFFLAYIICWIAFPANDKLEEDPKIRKFYRNPDGKVVAGVTSGLAAYFGIDIAIVRLLFVITAFGGVGIVAYIILWVSAPEATTITQKMEMKGEPVTLENIESNVKRSMNVSENSPENAFTKIILFPFRIIAIILGALGNFMKNLGPIFRILIGLFLLFIGGVFTFGVLIATAAFFGVVANDHSWIQGTNEISMFARDISPWAGFFGFLTAFVPAASIFLLGVSLLANRQILPRTYWLSGLGVWFIGVVGVGIFGTNYSLNFARDATYEETQLFILPPTTLILDADELSEGGWQDNVSVDLENSTSGDLRLEKDFRASGATRSEAMENARMIKYKVEQRDSLIVFDRWSTLAENASFREQRLRMKMYIPENKPFKMTPRFAHNLLNDSWDFRRKHSIDLDEVSEFTFVMRANDGIVCLDCPVLTEAEKEEKERNHDEEVISPYDFEDKREGRTPKKFDFDNFKKVEISNAFYVTIRQGATYSVEAVAENERDLNDIEMSVSGNTLDIEFDDVFISNRENVYIYITMPTLSGIDLSGAVRAKVIGFDNIDDLSVGLSGASRAAIDVEAANLDVEVNGASRLDIRGNAKKADFNATGASRIEAKNMKIDKVDAEANGASLINFGKVGDLNSDTSGASKITRQ